MKKSLINLAMAFGIAVTSVAQAGADDFYALISADGFAGRYDDSGFPFIEKIKSVQRRLAVASDYNGAFDGVISDELLERIGAYLVLPRPPAELTPDIIEAVFDKADEDFPVTASPHLREAAYAFWAEIYARSRRGRLDDAALCSIVADAADFSHINDQIRSDPLFERKTLAVFDPGHGVDITAEPDVGAQSQGHITGLNEVDYIDNVMGEAVSFLNGHPGLNIVTTRPVAGRFRDGTDSGKPALPMLSLPDRRDATHQATLKIRRAMAEYMAAVFKGTHDIIMMSLHVDAFDYKGRPYEKAFGIKMLTPDPDAALNEVYQNRLDLDDGQIWDTHSLRVLRPLCGDFNIHSVLIEAYNINNRDEQKIIRDIRDDPQAAYDEALKVIVQPFFAIQKFVNDRAAKPAARPS